MLRRAQIPVLGEAVSVLTFVGQLVFDHPFLSLLIFTGVFSGAQAIFNGNVLDVFRLTIWNLFSLFDFFLTDLRTLCFDLSILNYCVPSALVAIVNFIKAVALIGIIVKDALPLWLSLWQTAAQVSQAGRR